MPGFVDVLDFGAHPGASGPENFNAFQRAIDSTQGIGDTLLIPVGEYFITSPTFDSFLHISERLVVAVVFGILYQNSHVADAHLAWWP